MDHKYLVRANRTGLSSSPHDITYGDKKIITQPSIADAYDVVEALTEAHNRGEEERDTQHAIDHACTVDLGDPPPTIPEFTSGEGDRVGTPKTPIKDYNEMPPMFPFGFPSGRALMGMDTPQPEDYSDYRREDYLGLDPAGSGVPDHPYPHENYPRDTPLEYEPHWSVTQHQKVSSKDRDDDLPSIYPYGVRVPPEDHEGIIVRNKEEPYRSSGDTPPKRIRPSTREDWARTLVPPEPVMPENETVFDTTKETLWRHRLSPFWLGTILAVLAVTIAVFATIDWSLIWRMTGLSL